jgi:hypothetical protein
MSLASVEAKALSVLKTGEKDVLKALQAVGTAEPELETAADVAAVATGNSAILPIISKVGSLLKNAGALATSINASATGADKAQIAATGVNQLFASSGFFGTNAIPDETKWNQAMQDIAAAFGKAFDAVVPKSPTPASPAQVPAPVTLASSQA